MAMLGGSSEHLVAFFELEGQFANQGFEPCMLFHQARFTLTLFMDLKGFRGMGRELVPPLIILGLTDLMLITAFRDGLPLEALKHNPRFGFGIPFPSVHG